MKKIFFLFLLFFSLAFVKTISISNSSILTTKNSQHSLIGTKANEWQVSDWFNSEPLQLKNLKGKVVLVRWWTSSCPFCSSTAPSLNEFHKEFKNKGLEVIGFYHHKSNKPLNKNEVYEYSKKLGFKFPIAIDYNWKTLKIWWLNNVDAEWTSVSFLIDRRGIIQYIHPGGQYIKGENDYKLIRQNIEKLLNQ